MLFQKKIESAYTAQIFKRYDDRGFVNYCSAEDFPGLQVNPYRFKSSHGHTISGCFYNYPDFNQKRLVVFDHGFGGGRKAYMKEIEQLCKTGCRVFAYDHTGCMESGGENTGGFSQSLCDLDDCLKALKADEDVITSDISVVGHSWGGYATLNISALHPDIKRIVAISGYISVGKIIEQNFHGFLSLYRKHIMELEAASNPEYVKYDGVTALQNTKAKVLLIYSDNDGIVKKEYHFDVLKRELQNKDNVEFLLISGKGHNPNYTYDAVELISQMTCALKKRIPQTSEEKERFKNSFDWDKMTSQDEAVWNKINNFLK